MSFNPILDEFPLEYEGYLIRTDFRIGIQMILCLQDDELSLDDRKLSCLELLYGYGIPEDIELAWKGVIWFLNRGDTYDINNPDGSKPVTDEDETDEDTNIDDLSGKKEQEKDAGDFIDYNFDSTRLYTAFLRTYNIDITTVKMHFFRFMYLMTDLDSNTLYSSVRNIRSKSTKGLKGKDLRTLKEQKRLFGIEVKIDDSAVKDLTSRTEFDAGDFEMFMQ